MAFSSVIFFFVIIAGLVWGQTCLHYHYWEQRSFRFDLPFYYRNQKHHLDPQKLSPPKFSSASNQKNLHRIFPFLLTLTLLIFIIYTLYIHPIMEGFLFSFFIQIFLLFVLFNNFLFLLLLYEALIVNLRYFRIFPFGQYEQKVLYDKNLLC